MVTDALPPDVPLPAGTGSTGASIVAEVYFRIGGQMPQTNGGLGTSGSVLYYVNQALGIIAGSATFMWDVIVTSITIPTVSGVFDLSTLDNPLDLGGHFELANDNGIPIMRVDDERVLGRNSTQYINYNPVVFNEYYIVGPSPGILWLKPGLPVNTKVRISYKALPPTLDNTAGTHVRWTNPWMDALLCDFAEMEISRILGFGGWQDLQARCIQKLKDARTMFTMQRKETGPPDEVDAGAKGV